MVAAVGVPRPAFVLAREKNALVAADIVGPREEVLVMAVTLADVDAVYAPHLVFPLRPNVSRFCLLLAAAIGPIVGRNSGEVAFLAAGNWFLEIPHTVAAGSPLHHCPAVVVAIGKEGAPAVVDNLADDNVGPDWSTTSSLVGVF